MNYLDDRELDFRSFAWRDIIGQDLWQSFTVTASLTIVGTTTYVGRYRIVGRECQFQITLVSTTSIASTAGTHYVTLPISARGIAGMATMMNLTTNIAVGTCVINPSTSRCYVPAQAASGNTFSICGSYEV